MKYKILAREGKAKRAEMKTVHGTIQTPVFISARFAFPSLARSLYSIGDYASFFFLITYHMAPVRHTEE